MFREQLKHIEAVAKEEEDGSDSARVKRQASSVFPKWTANTVYFYFDASVSKSLFHIPKSLLHELFILISHQTSTGDEVLEGDAAAGIKVSLDELVGGGADGSPCRSRRGGGCLRRSRRRILDGTAVGEVVETNNFVD